jgi:hypothetical protein
VDRLFSGQYASHRLGTQNTDLSRKETLRLVLKFDWTISDKFTNRDFRFPDKFAKTRCDWTIHIPHLLSIFQKSRGHVKLVDFLSRR